MRRVFLAAVLVTMVAMSALAHEVTYKGTVVEVEQNRYAASDGVLGTIEIKINPGGRTRTFGITTHTRIWRGETPVSFADARIQRDEPVVLTWVDEEAEKGAQEIRLGAKNSESVAVLMEGAPGNLDVDAVRNRLMACPGVQEVRDLHVWTITSGLLSAHIVAERPSADVLPELRHRTGQYHFAADELCEARRYLTTSS